MHIVKIPLLVLLVASCYRPPLPSGMLVESPPEEDFQEATSENVSEFDEVATEGKKEEEKVISKPFIPIALTADNIKKLCAETPKTSMVVPMVFPGRTFDVSNCLWRQNGNLGSASNSINARETREVAVPLSKDKIICDMSIKSRRVDLIHDDDLYFLMDQFVVASDTGQAVNLMSNMNGLYVWDWAKIAGTPTIVTEEKVKYCLGGLQNCVVEENAVGSPFQVTLGTADVATIVAKLISEQAPSAKFSLVVSSDDERPGSCYHDEFALDAKINYVKNPNIFQ